LNGIKIDFGDREIAVISVKKFVTGPIETNTYLIWNEKRKGLVIDPSSGCDSLVRLVGEERIKLEAILLTHAHFDHLLGIPEILAAAGALPVYVHGVDAPALSDAQLNGSQWFGHSFTFTGPIKLIEEGRQRIESFDIRVLSVPGHTPGGCAILIENYCFSGDVLFAGSIGRSDLPGGNGRELLEGITGKLLVLSDDIIVCPGHGGRTTIGRERLRNPFLV
jgi:glyoxylase-like metal-dependent hydrolase (beta-lactamase superfamily II)